MSTDVRANLESGAESCRMAPLFKELNICRKHLAAYPPGHPLIATAADKTLAQLTGCLDSGELSLGIARDALLLGTTVLDRSNPAFSQVARALFEKDIGAVTFSAGLSAAELLAFVRLMVMSREQVHEQGGIQNILRAADVQNVRAQLIDYDCFLTTEISQVQPPKPGAAAKEPANLWESFVHGLVQGTLDPQGHYVATNADIDPLQAADIANQHFDHGAEGKGAGYSNAINAFLTQVEQDELEERYDLKALDKMSVFVQKLNPELRRQFLSGIFKSMGNRRGLAKEILERFPDEIILNILEEINARKTYAPPLILSLVQKLSSTITAEKLPASPHDLPSFTTDDIDQSLKSIFQENSVEEALPSEYRETLRNLLSVENMPGSLKQELAEIRDALLKQNVELQTGAVILEVMKHSCRNESAPRLEKNFQGLFSYFLETGDFLSLAELYEHREAGAGVSPARSNVFAAFHSADFLAEVMGGLHLWGKAKHLDIKLLIQAVGAPFVEPLLNQLAEEGSMSLRRYYLDCLVDLGNTARPAVLARLRDKRWFFVRNLLIILRKLNDPALLPAVRKLLLYPHPKVRQEALEACFVMKDPEADRLLLLALEETDLSIRLQTVKTAGLSRNPQVVKKLADLIDKGGFAAPELELRLAAIGALADIGSSAALPALEQLLKSKSLLNTGALNRLKAEALRSLEKYPAA
ncbi:HEAT repeat domain-containing protein, partial [Trichloromonas sp.]|uniref:HEAT repeat domain-containing protein n=1 Tax=Trichloromonas sp. TaxID=3069249 RepID=UPI003D814AEB